MHFYILSYALLCIFIISMLVGINKKQNQYGKCLEQFISFDIKNWQKLTKSHKIWPKTVLFRNIALIFSLEKPVYLENLIVREQCKRRTACTYYFGIFFAQSNQKPSYQNGMKSSLEQCLSLILHLFFSGSKMNVSKRLIPLTSNLFKRSLSTSATNYNKDAPKGLVK